MSPQATSSGCCAICGSEGIQRHHVGGENHIAWFTMELCVPHHSQVHKHLIAAGINLEYTDDPMERLIRAQQACQVFLWMLTEAQRQLNSQRPNGTQNETHS